LSKLNKYTIIELEVRLINNLPAFPNIENIYSLTNLLLTKSTPMKRNLILLFGLMAVFNGYTQSVTPSAYNCAGGSKVIGGNIYDWSFAEMMLVNTATSSNLIVTSGLLQPVDLNVGTEEFQAATGNVKVYPCPTVDLLNIETSFANSGKLDYQLLDMSGKLLLVNKASLSNGSNINFLSLSAYPAGEYVLRIVFSPENGISKFTQTFKVQKLQ
jgi:hypothetical protein